MTNAVASLREEAAEVFGKLGWPTPRSEEWRYTNLAPVQKTEWRADDSSGAAPASAAELAGQLQGTVDLLFLNGRSLTKPAEWPKGIRVLSGGEATIADWEGNAMVALNIANMQDGVRIEIAPGTIVEGFLHLHFIGRGDGIWSHPRNVIVVGENAQVSIVESYDGSGEYFTNAVTEIVAGPGAVIDHTRIQCESMQAFHVGNVFIRQDRAAVVTSRNFSIGAALARTETHAALTGEGASVTLDGLFAGTGSQHLDSRTVIDHVVPHCESLELYKGVLDQNARGVFDGRIVVRPDAVKTVSRQENRNLLLSETAIVDSKPTLEIHNDDVKCNHGSTIGQLQEEPLFYLRSRGIGEEEARSLLVYAFAGEMVDRMKLDPVREHVRRALFQTMPHRLPERRGGTR